MPGQALRCLWMDATSGKVADERVPQRMEISAAARVVTVGQECIGLAFGLVLLRASGGNPCRAGGGKVRLHHVDDPV
ncbi:MAG: hypothetical protein ABSB74_06215 [Tepidisphaeraceae bacterium]